MKKSKTFLVGMLATAFALSGCEFMGINLDPLGLADKLGIGQKENLSTKNNETQNAPQGETNNNSQSGSLLDILKGKAKTIAARMYNKSESQITFADYESDDLDSDVYYYDSSTLTFVDIEDMEESYGESFVNRLKGYLPSEATLYDNKDDAEEADLGYLWYDRYYREGEYTYNIWAESTDAFEFDDESIPKQTYGAIVIYKTSQQSAFDAYFSDGE